MNGFQCLIGPTCRPDRAETIPFQQQSELCLLSSAKSDGSRCDKSVSNTFWLEADLPRGA